MRREPQPGQKPRPLQLNATSVERRQPGQTTRAKPWARKGSAIGVGGEAREEGLQVFGEELIERGLLRLAAAVAAAL